MSQLYERPGCGRRYVEQHRAADHFQRDHCSRNPRTDALHERVADNCDGCDGSAHDESRRSSGRKSRKFYQAQQAAIGTLNGYIEETMTGQKVVKVFCHENVAEEEFEYLNDDLRGKQIFAQFFLEESWDRSWAT